MNPYRGLPDAQFWSRSMALVQQGQIDPVGRSRVISPGEKVATMGSCFAQHLARQISTSGLNYFVPETAPAELTAEEAAADNYGVFSARYGNIYTVRQALQLFDRAFGRFVPGDVVWERRDGFVDALRPRIDRRPKPSPDDVVAAIEPHLANVRRIFDEADWLVFTLGLTEGWRSKEDGTVYPVAPGTVAGSFDPTRYEFVNFSVGEVIADLEEFHRAIRERNPDIKLLLTVSPVPLVATYEPRHVLQSTTVSKSILRVAADEMERRHDDVYYFPSYEIITSPASGGRYYADDLRDVMPIGVRHVMRMFKRHFIMGPGNVPSLPSRDTALSLRTMNEIVCDEEAIEASLQQVGMR